MSGQVETAFAGIVGKGHVVTDPEALDSVSSDWRGRYKGRARCLVRPADTLELGAVVRICAEEGIPIVPQGGNTGVCGGAIPDETGRSIILSLARMNRIRHVDPVNNSMTVDGGVILAEVHRQAERFNRLFPLDLGSSGSCQIGGNVSTNAGGIGVLRYGNMRSLVLGLEAVLPDGEVLDCLKGLRKDNSGYDLKQVLIGAEGTLGVVTGAVLKLFPRPSHYATVFAALPSCDAGLRLFERLSASFGGRLSAFELMSGKQFEAVVQAVPGIVRPLAGPSDWYILLEIADEDADSDVPNKVEAMLAGMIGSGEVTDAVSATTMAQRERLWRIRHGVSQANVALGRVLSHDTSVPVSRVGDFIRTCEASLAGREGSLRLHHVGHVGDGNVHVVAIFPDSETFEREKGPVSDIVHMIALEMGGSIAAEHGVGQSLRETLGRTKSSAELQMMRLLKRSLDPRNIMNPGKVL